MVKELNNSNGYVHAYGCDATNERSVQQVMSLIVKDLGVPNLVVYCVQGFNPGNSLDTEVAAFEEAWRQNCLGAFIVGRESARLMVPRGLGTIIFTGGISSTIGKPGHLNMAVGKFGLRALAQVMARELSPRGIHVVNLIIDSGIATCGAVLTDYQIRPEELAEQIFSLHCQPSSTWTHELDVRPWNQSFWEHC